MYNSDRINKEMDIEEMESKRIECIKKMYVLCEDILSLNEKFEDKMLEINKIATNFNEELEKLPRDLPILELSTFRLIEHIEDFMMNDI